MTPTEEEIKEASDYFNSGKTANNPKSFSPGCILAAAYRQEKDNREKAEELLKAKIELLCFEDNRMRLFKKLEQAEARLKLAVEALTPFAEIAERVESSWKDKTDEIKSACGDGCDMGQAGPGPEGYHDPNCNINNARKALREIAGKE